MVAFSQHFVSLRDTVYFLATLSWDLMAVITPQLNHRRLWGGGHAKDQHLPGGERSRHKHTAEIKPQQWKQEALDGVECIDTRQHGAEEWFQV